MLVSHGEGRGMELIRLMGCLKDTCQIIVEGHVSNYCGGTRVKILWKDTWHVPMEGHMACSYGGTHGMFLWRDTWHNPMEGLKL